MPWSLTAFPPPLCLQALPAEDCTALLALGAGTPVAALDLVGSSEEAESKKEGRGCLVERKGCLLYYWLLEEIRRSPVKMVINIPLFTRFLSSQERKAQMIEIY